MLGPIYSVCCYNIRWSVDADLGFANPAEDISTHVDVKDVELGQLYNVVSGL